MFGLGRKTEMVTADQALALLCQRCRDQGAALVMVTHSAEAAARLDRRFVLTG